MSVRKYARVAAATAAALVLGACGSGGGASSGNAGPTGPPVQGGTATIIQATEPRTLDPVVIANSMANEPLLGNALYGELVINNPKTGETEYRMAQALDTADNGRTWTLKLRPGIVYSDGSPMTAADVKFNWEHMKDPAVASAYLGDAATIASVAVVDDLTAKITLSSPNTQFPALIWESALNWIGKSDTIKQGPAVVDSRPIGAGPFVLKEWRRQDVIKLARNEKYYDAPRPYLDAIDIRTISDIDQRFNTVSSGGADLSLESSWKNIDKAKKSSLQTSLINMGGGSGIALNTRRAPFDDVRARTALAKALDTKLIDAAINGGTGVVPDTMFYKDSPFFQDIALQKTDHAGAQKLFNELAAEGKPVKFTLSIFSASTQPLVESVQTQLSTFQNVTVESKTIDLAQYGKTMAARDFDAVTTSLTETRIWRGLFGQSGSNFSGINDDALNSALADSRQTLDETKLKADYDVVQRRFAELTPMILYTRLGLGVVASKKVGGIQQYGFGSLLPETLWIQK